MASTLFSEMPMLRLFGIVAVIVLVTVVVGAVLLLPSITAVIEGHWPSAIRH